VGFPNPASTQSKSHFWTQNVDFPSSPNLESIGARIIYITIIVSLRYVACTINRTMTVTVTDKRFQPDFIWALYLALY